jgi:hypothetical protein
MISKINFLYFKEKTKKDIWIEVTVSMRCAHTTYGPFLNHHMNLTL